MKSLIIVNPADCIGCRTCEVACVVAHPSEQELNADVFLPRLKVQRLDSISAPVMCHQCENAPCVGACPVGALTMGEQVVQTNSARCIGCQSCVSACPFGMITIHPDWVTIIVQQVLMNVVSVMQADCRMNLLEIFLLWLMRKTFHVRLLLAVSTQLNCLNLSLLFFLIPVNYLPVQVMYFKKPLQIKKNYLSSRHPTFTSRKKLG